MGGNKKWDIRSLGVSIVKDAFMRQKFFHSLTDFKPFVCFYICNFKITQMDLQYRKKVWFLFSHLLLEAIKSDMKEYMCIPTYNINSSANKCLLFVCLFYVFVCFSFPISEVWFAITEAIELKSSLAKNDWALILWLIRRMQTWKNYINSIIIMV